MLGVGIAHGLESQCSQSLFLRNITFEVPELIDGTAWKCGKRLEKIDKTHPALMKAVLEKGLVACRHFSTIARLHIRTGRE